MRLLNAHTLSFKSFDSDETIPKYAILSHTWADDEVSYCDMCKFTDAASSMRGFEKIQHCAEQAKIDGIDFFWVDTCCIDKSSSAELSEAINSMFRWYQNLRSATPTSSMFLIYLRESLWHRYSIILRTTSLKPYLAQASKLRTML